MTLGIRIKEYRIKRGYTQNQIATKLGMTEANFSSYERGKSEPPSDKLNQISSILKVSTDYLLGKTNDPLPRSKDHEPEIDEETYMIARKLKKLTPQNRTIFNDLLNSMGKYGEQALEDDED